MRVVFKAPDKDAFEMEIPNSLNALQSVIGGNIEVLEIENGIDVVVDEEGLIKHRVPNIVHLFEGIVYGNFKKCPLYGNILFCSTNNEDFDSLDDEQMVYALDLCEREGV